MIMSTVKEGHWAIADTIVEKITKTRGPRHPWGATKTSQIPTAAYNTKEWMQGLEEAASEMEVRNGHAGNQETEWRNTHSQYVGRRCSMLSVRSSIPSNKVPGRLCLSSKCACCSRFRYSSLSTQAGFNRSTQRIWNEIISTRAWTPDIGACWPTMWMANTPLATLTCSLQPRSWTDGPKPEIPCSWRPPQLEDGMLPSHRHWGICFPLGSWRAIVPSLLHLP